MKKTRIYAAVMSMALALGLTLTSCDDDKEMFQISDLPTQSTMATDKNAVVISNDNLGQTVCTLTYSASDTEIKSTDGTSFGAGAYWLQYTLDPTFASAESKSVVPNPGNNTFSITGLDLNTMAVKLGAKYDVPTDIYFRILHAYNENSKETGVASDPITVKVTPMEVPMITVVSKEDIDVVYATLQINAETGRFEGTYPAADKKEAWNKAWNFYFVDTKGVVYGCDDDWSKPDEGVNRSYKLMSGRSVGDDYSHWFDPGIAADGVTMWFDLGTMEWGFIFNKTSEYPDKATAVCGGNKEELKTVLDAGLPSGVYTGKITASASSISFEYSGDKTFDVEVVDADGNKLSALEVGSDYIIELNLVDKKAILKLNLISATLTISSNDQGKPLAVLHSDVDADGNPTGVYRGFVAFEADDHFTAIDGNGVHYGVNDGWDQFSFLINNEEGDGHRNFWTPGDAVNGLCYAVFDINNAKWEVNDVTSFDVVSKESAEVVYATLKYNAETGRFEGAYPGDAEVWNSAWNFYMVLPNGVMFGCDDEWSTAEGINRSYKLVAGRSIGDNYSSWFDPSIPPVTMRVDPVSMTWDWEVIATDKKDLSGVSIIIVGSDMGWHEDWAPEDGIKMTANGDVYTAVFENVALTDQFGFRATSPAAGWLGPDNFASLGDNLVKDGNIKAKTPGIYKITVTATANADGTITYTVDGQKTGNLPAKDLSNQAQGIKGSFNGWTVVNQSKPAVNGNIYTYTFSGIEMEADAEFGFDGDLNWVGKGGLTVNSDLVSEEGGNLSVKEAGTYTFTLIATANSDGTVSYALSATK
ncbi:MAG: SusE domain-containing protein [Bacteroidales bacterium]|nr:SusE domain-containing protein [Bacteroidales bacterium]